MLLTASAVHMSKHTKTSNAAKCHRRQAYLYLYLCRPTNEQSRTMASEHALVIHQHNGTLLLR